MLEGMKGVSSFAGEIDLAIWVVMGISIGIFVVVVGVMFYFLYTYSAQKNSRDKIKNIEHNLYLEIAWTVIPTFLLAIMFYYGYTSLKIMREVPKDTMDVNVTGQMWFWTHEYANGKTTKDLYVPVGTNVKLNITAKINDVLHSYYVPAFRFKQDAVPGKMNTAWFNAKELGNFDIQCAEYCGTRHSYMLAKIHVLDKETFDTWYKSDKKTPFDQETSTKHPGLDLLETNGCLGCHSLDGSILVGPSYKDLFGRKLKVSVNGTLKELIADEAYIKQSILEPDSEVVDGFSAGMMSSYKDILSEKQIDEIIDYFKNAQNVPKENMGDKATSILESNGCLGCHSLDGTVLVGPSYKDMFGHTIKVSVNGTLKEVLVDEAYLKRAILEPDGEVVEGFSAGMMSSYKGILSDNDIAVVIEYFKGL